MDGGVTGHVQPPHPFLCRHYQALAFPESGLLPRSCSIVKEPPTNTWAYIFSSSGLCYIYHIGMYMYAHTYIYTSTYTSLHIIDRLPAPLWCRRPDDWCVLQCINIYGELYAQCTLHTHRHMRLYVHRVQMTIKLFQYLASLQTFY